MTKAGLLPQNGIIVPTDFSDASKQGFYHALKLALAMRTNLRMLHVDSPQIDQDFSRFPHVRDTLMIWNHQTTAPTDLDLKNMGIGVRKLVASGNDPSKAIAESLEEHPDQLLVLSPRKINGLKNLWHKSVAVSIMHRTQSLCLFVPEGCKPFVKQESGELDLQNIMFPVDHTPDPTIALDIAMNLTQTLDLPRINAFRLHVGSMQETLPLDVANDHPWRWQTIFGMGEPGDIIIGEAKTHQIDLIVMVTRGRKGFFDALRGSITERVARYAPCPVLTIYEVDDND